MTRLKTLMAEVLVALVVVAGFGFGLMAMGFALVVGLVVALAARLAGPQILTEAERRAADLRARSARRVDPEAGQEGDHAPV